MKTDKDKARRPENEDVQGNERQQLVLGLSGRKGLQLRVGVCLDILLQAKQYQA